MESNLKNKHTPLYEETISVKPKIPSKSQEISESLHNERLENIASYSIFRNCVNNIEYKKSAINKNTLVQVNINIIIIEYSIY